MQNIVLHSEYNIYFGYDPIYHLGIDENDPMVPKPWTSGWNRGYKCAVTEITNYQIKCKMPPVGPDQCSQVGMHLQSECDPPLDHDKMYSGIGYPAMYTEDHIGQHQFLDFEVIWNYQFPTVGKCHSETGLVDGNCTHGYSYTHTPIVVPDGPVSWSRSRNPNSMTKIESEGTTRFDLYDIMYREVDSHDRRQALNFTFPWFPKAVGNASDYTPHSSVSQNNSMTIKYGSKGGLEPYTCDSITYHRLSDEEIMTNYEMVPWSGEKEDVVWNIYNPNGAGMFRVGYATCHHPIITRTFKPELFEIDIDWFGNHREHWPSGLTGNYRRQGAIAYVPQELSSINPRRGSMFGGNWVSIYGNNFFENEGEKVMR
jgi:hypothetical protein